MTRGGDGGGAEVMAAAAAMGTEEIGEGSCGATTPTAIAIAELTQVLSKESPKQILQD
jgi:hypothetical protein